MSNNGRANTCHSPEIPTYSFASKFCENVHTFSISDRPNQPQHSTSDWSDTAGKAGASFPHRPTSVAGGFCDLVRPTLTGNSDDDDDGGGDAEDGAANVGLDSAASPMHPASIAERSSTPRTMTCDHLRVAAETRNYPWFEGVTLWLWLGQLLFVYTFSHAPRTISLGIFSCAFLSRLNTPTQVWGTFFCRLALANRQHTFAQKTHISSDRFGSE